MAEQAGAQEITPVEQMDLVGGDIALDLVNTATGRAAGPLKEKLRRYDDLVTWAERVELVSPERARRLRASARREPAEAERVLERARALREDIYRVFAPGGPDAGSVDAVGAAAAESAARRRLERTESGYALAWPESDALDQPLWPVALSAAELLTSEGDRRRVKQCASETCDWLFLDRSRNRSRRWCDMKDCGNRAKARRFQARRRRKAGS